MENGEIFSLTVRPWIGDGHEIEIRSSDKLLDKLGDVRPELIALADKILREAGAWPEMSKTASVNLTITHDTKWATIGA